MVNVWNHHATPPLLRRAGVVTVAAMLGAGLWAGAVGRPPGAHAVTRAATTRDVAGAATSPNTTVVRALAQGTPAPRVPRHPRVTGGMVVAGRHRLLVQLECRHNGTVRLARPTGQIGARHFTCRRHHATAAFRLPHPALRRGFTAAGQRLRAIIRSRGVTVRTRVTLRPPPWQHHEHRRVSTNRTATQQLANAAGDVYWRDAQAICQGSGSGTGGTLVVDPSPWALLDAAGFGDQVWWKAWIYAVNPSTGVGHWEDITGEWRHYVPWPDGAGTDGTIYDDGAGLVVNIGGTTAPGVYLAPVTATIGSGWLVFPYIEAYSRSAGSMTHLVPVDAQTVQVVAPNGCQFQ